MNLLLDLGNTRIKWVLDVGADWSGAAALEWRRAPDAAALAAAWGALSRPSRIWVASVVDEGREGLVAEALQQCFGLRVDWVRTPAEACGVRNAYAEPERLGVDRFLAMVDAFVRGHAPVVVAGCGTALTLDALAGDGRHLGGLIAPGPRLMQQSILASTARVRPQAPGRVLDVADNTADALASGCWQAAAALIERFRTRMAGPLGGSPALLVNGGDADTLAGLIDAPMVHQDDAVLRGLRAWARQHATSPE